MSFGDFANSLLKPGEKKKSTAQVDGALYDEMLKIYGDISGQDWHRLFPYSFEIVSPEDPDKRLIYTLPIPPESLNVNPVSASEATPTLGGVVEETSETTFWNLTLAGTTGIAVSKSERDSDDYNTAEELQQIAKHFREVLPTSGPLSSVIRGTVQNAVSVASRISGVIGAAGNLDFNDALEQALLPKLPYFDSSVNGQSNGYTEIHKFHKFILLYSLLNSRKNQDKISDKNLKNKKWALYFRNAKDGQKFRVIVQNFQISKSVRSPYLYNYQIIMKGWDINPVGAEDGLTSAFDRFGPDGDLQSVNLLTATGALSRVKSLTRSFKQGIQNPLGTFVSVPPVV